MNGVSRLGMRRDDSTLNGAFSADLPWNKAPERAIPARLCGDSADRIAIVTEQEHAPSEDESKQLRYDHGDHRRLLARPAELSMPFYHALFWLAPG